jgi:hypothetical protein
MHMFVTVPQQKPHRTRRACHAISSAAAAAAGLRYKLCTLSVAAAAGAHWVKEDEDEVHMVGHPHDAVFDWKGVLQGQRQNSKAGV